MCNCLRSVELKVLSLALIIFAFGRPLANKSTFPYNAPLQYPDILWRSGLVQSSRHFSEIKNHMTHVLATMTSQMRWFQEWAT